MRKTRNGTYEGMYILSASLSDDARNKTLDQIQNGITQKQGTIRKVHDWGRRRLAYEINGKREGYYYVIYFDAPTQIIRDLWSDYHLTEDLVRFQTMRIEEDEVMETLEFKPIRVQA